MTWSLARVLNTLTALTVVTLGTVFLASPSTAEGNNGTVKIDGWTLDHGTGNGAPNRNEPHVDCAFDVEWYNYDASVTSTITFEMQAPTPGSPGDYQTTTLLDDDDASGANAEGLDGVVHYTLTPDASPHTRHGFHVKLTVNTPTSNGAEVKHKVFWMEPCDTEVPRKPITPQPEVSPSTCVEGVYGAPTLVATPLEHAVAGPVSYTGNGNGIWEPGETANVDYEVVEGDEDEYYLTVFEFEFPFLDEWVTDEECGETGDDECQLPGIQPEGFPCSQEPQSGTDPWTGQPDCDTRTISSGYAPWTRTWTFVADPPGPGSWVLGDKRFGTPVVTSTQPVTQEQCPPPPAMPVQQTTEGCAPGFGLPPGAWSRDGVQEYVLDGVTWVPEPEADISWDEWEGVAWTDDEITTSCAEVKPAVQVRTMSGGRESCRLGGAVAWTDTWTTDWVFNTGTQEWELGTEIGPMRDREFTPYTRQQLVDRGCVEEPEVAGEQVEVIDHELPAVAPEVAGEQAVPGAVNAGTAGSPAPAPPGRSPLWLVAIGGGVALIGFSGWRRRTTAVW